jgi:hypothetical protein
VELTVQYAPIAVFAFERLQPHVRSSVYREGSSYGKSFTAAGDIAQIGFWVEIGRGSARNREKLDATHFLEYGDACVVAASPPRRNVACKVCIGMVCALYASVGPRSVQGVENT